MNNIYIYQKDLIGHRKEYLILFIKILKKKFKKLRIHNGKNFIKALRCKYLFIPSISDNPIFFLFISIIRSFFLKKKILAINLRGRYLFNKGIYNLFKKFIFIKLNQIKYLKIIYIPSSRIYPLFKKLSNYSLDDPQLWDKDFFFKFKNYKKKKQNKIIIQFLGRFNKNKGAEDFIKITKIFENNVNYIFKINGVVDEKYLNTVKKQKNIILSNKYFKDYELPSIYINSDFIWGFYDKSYNQSSGISGRAIQFNNNLILRSNSIISKYNLYFKNIYNCKNVFDIKRLLLLYKRKKKKLNNLKIKKIKKENVENFLNLFIND